MQHLDQILRMTEHVTNELFKIARAMPVDRQTWKPLENGRSALEQLQECAQTPLFFLVPSRRISFDLLGSDFPKNRSSPATSAG